MIVNIANLSSIETLTPSQLWTLWGETHKPTPDQARRFFGCASKAHVKYLQSIADYACNKAVSMTHRAEGNVNAALPYERTMRICYMDLPEHLRW